MALKPKSRLGRGLSSLISISDLSEDTTPPGATDIVGQSDSDTSRLNPAVSRNTIHEIGLELIGPNPHQPRRVMNESTIAELAASLKSTGVIQPIVVRKAGERFELIAGERRWRAARMAGLAAIPAIIREVTTLEQAQMALIENIQREDLNPIDRALAYRTLIEQLGLTQAELAARTGEDRSSVANYLRLLDLATGVQSLVVEGKLSMGHAKILAGISDKAEQERLAELCVSQSLSVRNLERQLAEAKPAGVRAAPEISPHIQDLEHSISQQLGLRVQVRSAQKGRGKLIVHYGSLDQFDELIGRLGIRIES